MKRINLYRNEFYDIDIQSMKSKINYILRMLSNSFLKYTNKKLFNLSQTLVNLIVANQEDKVFDFINKNLKKLTSKEIMLITRFLAFHEVLTNIVEDIYLNDFSNPWHKNLWNKNDPLYKIISKKNLSKKTLDRLNNLDINIVLTAHPTQVQRETTLKLIRKITDALIYSEESKNFFNVKVLTNEENIQALIDILWQVSILRDTKINVENELKNVLNYFDTTFFKILPKLNYKFETIKNQIFKNKMLDFKTPLTINSWIGGDRDGNPYVNANSLEKAMLMQTNKVFDYYAKTLLRTYEDLLIHKTFLKDEKIKKFTDEFELANRPNEYFAKAIIKIISKLENTYRFLTNSEDVFFAKSRIDIIFDKYNSCDEFSNDLKLIYEILVKNKCENIVNRNLIDLIYASKTFKFHLMSIDIRQNSKNHLDTVNNILKINKLCDNYIELDEQERINVLKANIDSYEMIDLSLLPEESMKEIAIFKKIKAINDVYHDAIKNYLISNSESLSDILEVLFLFKIVGLYQQNSDKQVINIVPLFETINDLNNSKKIIEKLINDSLMREIVKKNWNNKIEVLLGYSDSCKDGGYLSSSWSLFNVQKEISNLCYKNNIKINFFHGRGGTIGRGGGPSYEAIQAQPHNSIEEKLRFTEQGEIIWAKYSNPNNGWFNLEKVLNATIEKVINYESHVDKKETSFDKIMNQLSVRSFNTYQNLVYKNKNFSKLFFDITPIKDISKLKIGSRPVSRNNQKAISNLRSIPWVFSWSQTRIMLPGWYGLGSALNEMMDTKLETFKQWYKKSPFFRSLISNVEMLLSKTNLNIGLNYFKLSKNKHALEIYNEIKREHDLTYRIILQIMDKKDLLDDFDYLKLSLKYRIPFLNALNYFQIELLSKNNFKKDKNIENAILITINGIATGLRNSG